MTISGQYTPGGAMKKIGDRTNSLEKTTPQQPRKSMIEGVSKYKESNIEKEETVSNEEEFIEFPKISSRTK